MTQPLPLDLSPEQLTRAYRAMALARRIEARGWDLVRQNKVLFAINSAGHEAVSVGRAMAMGPRDFLVPHYRETAGLVYVGITPTMLLSTLYGNVEAIGRGRQPYGYWGSRAHRVISASGPQPNHLTHGIGTAFAAKYLGVDEVSWSTFGDGGASRGEFHEGLNFAAIHRLPVVFVCHTNGYTQSVPLDLQSATQDISAHAAGYGIPGVEVDGMDVFAVYEAACQARARAAAGNGPTLIEAKTYRYFPNTSNDDDRRYRSREEVDEARKRDPIERLARFLAEYGVLDDDARGALDAGLDDEVRQAALVADSAPLADPGEAFGPIYATEEVPWP